MPQWHEFRYKCSHYKIEEYAEDEQFYNCDRWCRANYRFCSHCVKNNLYKIVKVVKDTWVYGRLDITCKNKIKEKQKVGFFLGFDPDIAKFIDKKQFRKSK